MKQVRGGREVEENQQSWDWEADRENFGREWFVVSDAENLQGGRPRGVSRVGHHQHCQGCTNPPP